MNVRQQGRQAAAAVLTASLALGLAACGENNTAGTDAVAQGGTFEFVSPGGQTEITYDEADREPVGDLQGESLMEPGETVGLEDFTDQVVVLNSWGQWCGPCRSEADDLQRVQQNFEDHGSGTILGINVRDSVADKARDFVTDNGITYPSIYDPPFKSALALGGLPASVIPTTIVLDRQHRPAKVFLREVNDDELWAAVEPLLDDE
ncbi:TlpA family protein disulfide reductase [Corynebacterium kalidii]|uniref:TlpA family protein disulfide reductase n=1 Tax=Corynebacterium kalidii TaxID=2931982 RepID=A0A9X1WG10_9CORY|nr:TlpA disulfide reductase family protein [Corynebacterium kalidii]MCJ7857763.1 TlpA family protein disulfide reductase [Corynebacterium kalidii]